MVYFLHVRSLTTKLGKLQQFSPIPGGGGEEGVSFAAQAGLQLKQKITLVSDPLPLPLGWWDYRHVPHTQFHSE